MLSVIIVSWNVADLLRECLTSVYAQDVPLEVIVVDSASSDGSPEMVRAEFPQTTLIALEENVGFTRGNNIGIAEATGDHILLLNPDTVVLDDAFATMLTYMTQHPQVGGLGPQLLNADGTVQSSRRRFPTLATAFFESTWLQPYAPQRLLDRFYMLDQPDDATLQVDWVQGAALMVRRAVIDDVGLLDEGFFMYSEELDWQRRIKTAGWEIVYYPEAQIIHYGGKSSEQVVAQRDIYFHTSKIRYFRKHHGRLIALILRLFLLANYLWQIGVEAAKGAVGHKRDLRQQRVRAYWQVLRSGLKG